MVNAVTDIGITLVGRFRLQREHAGHRKAAGGWRRPEYRAIS